MTTAVAIFAKTPGLSPIKTRLAAGIGVAQAEQFYAHSVKCLEALILEAVQQTAHEIVPYWAVGEQAGLEYPLWQNLNRLWTGPGSLGQRLGHVYATLLQQHSNVIMLGTDLPHLQPATIIGAHEYLKLKQGPVIGPTDDGGYYLFGGYSPLPQALWQAVPYSVCNTCAVFVKELKPYGAIHFLAQNFDVDFAADLARLPLCKNALQLSAQQDLLNWILSLGK